MRRLALLVVLAAGCLLTPAALGDGDPASDVLLAANVFYPYTPSVSGPLMRELNSATATAAKSGESIKVALIASPVDLGVIPSLFGHPMQYADYLDQEISFTRPQPLLVVMAAGYGTESLTSAAKAAVAALPPPTGKSSDALATAALKAVDKIAAADGHPLPASGAVASGSGESSHTALVIALLIAAALAAGAAVLVIVLRRRRAPV